MLHDCISAIAALPAHKRELIEQECRVRIALLDTATARYFNHEEAGRLIEELYTLNAAVCKAGVLDELGEYLSTNEEYQEACRKVS